MGGPAKIDGKYHDCTDNFFICKFKVGEVEFISSEHYFQWAKCVNDKDRKYVLEAGTGMGSWVRGNEIKLMKGWDAYRVDKMYDGNLEKFKQNDDLKKILTSTKGPISCGGSTSFWNKWNKMILERIREELREEKEQNSTKIINVKKAMSEYRKMMEKKLKLK